MAERKELRRVTVTAVVENSKSLSKSLYKLELVLIKIIPVIISVGYFLNTPLTYFGLRIEFLSVLCGMSLLPLLFIYLSSIVFKFCLRHRLFIYYITFSEAEAWVDYLIGIPISAEAFLIFDCLVFLILIAIVIYLKFKDEPGCCENILQTSQGDG